MDSRTTKKLQTPTTTTVPTWTTTTNTIVTPPHVPRIETHAELRTEMHKLFGEGVLLKRAPRLYALYAPEYARIPENNDLFLIAEDPNEARQG
jgi:hypothetical protein